MNLPLVSVIIPCYNHERYIAQCIASVLQQTYPNIQLIVIDDGSKDRSVALIEELCAVHQFEFEAQQNMGLSATLNKAIRQYARGKYIAVVASDDYWHPEKIKRQVEFYEQQAHYGLVFCDSFLVNDKSEIIGEIGRQRLKNECSFEDLMLDRYGIPALTVMIKKEVYDTVGLFDEKMVVEDWDMWLRIADQYKIGFLDEKLAYYRAHDSNISARVELIIDNQLQIIKKWEYKYPELCARATKYWKIRALSVFAKKNKAVAAKYLDNSWCYLRDAKYRKYLFKYLF